MKMKKYIVDTMPEAMKLIRSELGQDAVILSTKSVRAGGFAGLLRKQKIEVVAAVEEETERETTGTALNPAIPRNAVPEAYRNAGNFYINKELGRTIQSSSENKGMKPQTSPSETTQAADSSLVRPKELQPHPGGADFSVLSSKLQPDQKNDINGENVNEKLLNEISQMKMLMASLAESHTNEVKLPEDLNKIREILKKQGVSSDIWNEWLESAKQSCLSNEQCDGELLVKASIQHFLSEHVGEGIKESTRIVYVAGPTGVGKTTTIAKLAAQQMFQHKQKVGLITADTYRISAIEQLRTYASILGIPLEVVQSPADTKRALDRLADCDLILMDTAGRNYRNELTVSELKSLLPDEPGSELILVLSLTAKTEDMYTILDHFHKFGPVKLIFTKLDETDTLGSLFNVLHQYPSKLAYITTGQNVPDDIMRPDPNKLADFLLGSELS